MAKKRSPLRIRHSPAVIRALQDLTPEERQEVADLVTQIAEDPEGMGKPLLCPTCKSGLVQHGEGARCDQGHVWSFEELAALDED